MKKSDVKILPIFDLIAKVGNIPERDMFNTFNMGVGMSIVVAKEDAEKAQQSEASEEQTSDEQTADNQDENKKDDGLFGRNTDTGF